MNTPEANTAKPTQPLFDQLNDVHHWFTGMKFAFRDLWEEGLLLELDPDIDVDDEDADDFEMEADHCRDCCEAEYQRAVRHNIPPVLDALRMLTQEANEAIAFLEAQLTMAGTDSRTAKSEITVTPPSS
jgi:hypothetical protein